MHPSIGDIPYDIIRTRMIPRLSARSAARLSKVSTTYRANAQAQSRAHLRQMRDAVEEMIAQFARKLARAMSLFMYTHLKRPQVRHKRVSMGKYQVRLTLENDGLTMEFFLDRWHPWDINRIDPRQQQYDLRGRQFFRIRRAQGTQLLEDAGFQFSMFEGLPVTATAHEKWLLPRASRQAMRLYNAAPAPLALT